MAGGTLEPHLGGYNIVKVCLPMASETLECHLEGHDIVKVCLSMASEALHLTSRVMIV